MEVYCRQGCTVCTEVVLWVGVGRLVAVWEKCEMSSCKNSPVPEFTLLLFYPAHIVRSWLIKEMKTDWSPRELVSDNFAHISIQVHTAHPKEGACEIIASKNAVKLKSLNSQLFYSRSF